MCRYAPSANGWAKRLHGRAAPSSVLINDSVFSDSDVTAAKNVISEFFTLFGDQQYQKMNTLCAGDAASLDFSYGVFGMKEAKLKSCTYNGDYSARANKLVFECSFTMKPTANSVYDPNQTSTSCLIYVRKVGSQFWIDEFCKWFLSYRRKSLFNKHISPIAPKKLRTNLSFFYFMRKSCIPNPRRNIAQHTLLHPVRL